MRCACPKGICATDFSSNAPSGGGRILSPRVRTIANAFAPLNLFSNRSSYAIVRIRCSCLEGIERGDYKAPRSNQIDAPVA